MFSQSEMKECSKICNPSHAKSAQGILANRKTQCSPHCVLWFAASTPPPPAGKTISKYNYHLLSESEIDEGERIVCESDTLQSLSHGGLYCFNID